MSDAKHWNAVYAAREDSALTWYEARPGLSLELIQAWSDADDAVIDVGGGAARLADHLVAEGARDVAVLDLSQKALDVARARLGADADRVEWIRADVTAWQPERRWQIWHDRAVFHFLCEPRARAGYMRALLAGLAPGGHAIIATFALDGPEKCSNLPVVRYSPESLAEEFERLAPGAFEGVEARAHVHVSPGGLRQSFQVSVLRRREFSGPGHGGG